MSEPPKRVVPPPAPTISIFREEFAAVTPPLPLWPFRRKRAAVAAAGPLEHVVVVQQDETGAFIAEVPSLPGCHSWGETKEDALMSVKEAIRLYLEANGSPASRVVSVEKVFVEG
jgi:predicted RNase H-like HicB family nuclease